MTLTPDDGAMVMVVMAPSMKSEATAPGLTQATPASVVCGFAPRRVMRGGVVSAVRVVTVGEGEDGVGLRDKLGGRGEGGRVV